jgi:hypothetical protein
MNRVVFLIALVAFVFISAPRSIGADLVKWPTGLAAWTIEVSKSQANSDAPELWSGSVTKVDILQGDSVSSNTATYQNGKSRVIWTIPHTNLILTEDPNGTAFITPPTRYINVPYLASAFSWLSPSVLADKAPVTYQGKSCFHYVSTTTLSDMVGIKIVTKTVPCEAWIESKTLLPVALDDGQTLALFTFSPPPQEQPVLPPKFASLLKAYKGTMGIPHSN